MLLHDSFVGSSLLFLSFITVILISGTTSEGEFWEFVRVFLVVMLIGWCYWNLMGARDNGHSCKTENVPYPA